MPLVLLIEAVLRCVPHPNEERVARGRGLRCPQDPPDELRARPLLGRWHTIELASTRIVDLDEELYRTTQRILIRLARPRG